jgi:hypothetical protein
MGHAASATNGRPPVTNIRNTSPRKTTSFDKQPWPAPRQPRSPVRSDAPSPLYEPGPMFLGCCCVPWVSGEVVLFGNQAVPEVTRAAPVFGLSSRGLKRHGGVTNKAGRSSGAVFCRTCLPRYLTPSLVRFAGRHPLGSPYSGLKGERCPRVQRCG